jgi:hypothetical protein
MNNRKVQLGIIMGIIALAVTAGGAGMLLGTREAIAPATFSAILTGVACGLLIWFGRLYESPQTRFSGITLTTGTVVCFLLILCDVWQFGGWQLSELLEGLAFSLGLTALLGALFLWVGQLRGGRAAGIVGVVIAACGLAGMLVATWITFARDSFGIQDRVIESALTVDGIGLLVVGALLGMHRHRPWRWIGVAASVALLGVSLHAIWYRYSSPELIMPGVSIAGMVAYLNFILQLDIRPSLFWPRSLAIGATAAALGMGDASAWSVSGQYADAFNRIAGAMGIIAGGATLAVVIATRIGRKTRDVAPPVEIKEISLTCPSCSAKQALPIGESACGTCGLKIFIRLEMPRCPNCEYSLLMNPSDRCPECGTELRPSRPTQAVTPPLAVR